jgi:hypothetical protein
VELDQRKHTEDKPAFEIHLGEIFVKEYPGEQVEYETAGHARHCIIWINGKRWEGDLRENTQRDIDNLRNASEH